MYSRTVLVLLLFMQWRAGEAMGLSLDTAAESNQTHGVVKVPVFEITLATTL